MLQIASWENDKTLGYDRLQTPMLDRHLDAMQKAWKVLTPEQVKKLKSLRARPWGAGQGMMAPPQQGQESPGGMMHGGGMH